MNQFHIQYKDEVFIVTAENELRAFCEVLDALFSEGVNADIKDLHLLNGSQPLIDETVRLKR